MTAYMELSCVKPHTSTKPFPASTNYAFTLSINHSSKPIEFIQAPQVPRPRQWLENRRSLFSSENLRSHLFQNSVRIIRAQLSRKWLNRLAQANSIHIGHSIQLVFSPPSLISDWIYKKLPPNAGTITVA